MKPRRYSASDLAALGFCEVKAVRDQHFGEQVTAKQTKARERGAAEHERFHREVSRKGPCFIATVACGPDHPTTWRLRRFRDQSLRRSVFGRRCIALYYRTSPPIARWLGRHPRLARLVGAGLKHLADFLVEERV